MSPTMGSELVALLPRLRRYALALCRSPSTADDLVQSACARALDNAESWQPGSRLDAWVFRILRNLWIDTTRRSSRVYGSLDDEQVAAIRDVRSEQQTNDRMLLQDVLRAVDALPDEQREVLLLVCVEELAYREAADVLGVPVGTVMSRLARARKRLIDTAEGRDVTLHKTGRGVDT